MLDNTTSCRVKLMDNLYQMQSKREVLAEGIRLAWVN